MSDFAKQLNRALQAMYDNASACKDGILSPVAIDRGLNLLAKLGYPENLLEKLPPDSLEIAFPCANPLSRITSLAPKTILDLGCGAALDAFFCAHSLPCLQRITGLDGSSKLLAKGVELLRHFPSEADKISLFQADLNHLGDSLFGQLKTSDLILMNGSFNLIYDKQKFFAELPSLLSKNGTLLIYDFLLTEELPPGFSDEIDNWLWNIGGALSEVELEKLITTAGFKVVEINEIERIDPVARCEIVMVHQIKNFTAPSSIR